MTSSKGKPSASMNKYGEQVRKLALAYPESHEDHPWDHSAFKVKAKTFVFMALDETGMRISLKLRQSLFDALALPFAEPTHYGLGKHGWVTFSFTPDEKINMDMLKAWIDESFREIAPKTILKKLAAESAR